MNKSYLAFIVLVVILFIGIAIMLKPTYFLTDTTYKSASQDEPLSGRLVPKELIVMASVLIISGLVGLSVLGFRLFKDSNYKEVRST